MRRRRLKGTSRRASSARNTPRLTGWSRTTSPGPALHSRHSWITGTSCREAVRSRQVATCGGG
eukprot:2046403-Pyramimonas_sp.AAC.2